ncbi:hypothetical protein [Gimesia aquarii]|uniref:Uncharacterized protein n=1 Tax=Gimesia aquarii TaxID=2527964 RepID=A0A517W3L0_9PLAN|nr:hypothetical protein [Gimesia aquarii]QDT99845.1 hypothetical protein V144x_53580 [Gimesia aquarii]
MTQTHQADDFEFAQEVRKTCHQLNNFLTVLRCQHDYLGVLPSAEIKAELVSVLKDLDPLVESAASQIRELSTKCNTLLEGTQKQ